MKERHFKVWMGYTQFVPITEKELAKAQTAQMTGKIAVFENGQVRGSAITFIEPDYHKMLGYNYGYTFQGEDWAEVGKLKEEYAKIISESYKKLEAIYPSLGSGNK